MRSHFWAAFILLFSGLGCFFVLLPVLPAWKLLARKDIQPGFSHADLAVGIGVVLWGALQLVQIYMPWAVKLIRRHPDQRELWLKGQNHLVDWQRYGGGRMVNGLIIVAISWFMEMAAECAKSRS